VRWPLEELTAYLNDGQRYILTKTPHATAQERTLTLAEGVAQTVPPDCFALLDLLRNAGGPAIRQVARGALDAAAPGWAAMRPAVTVIHFMQDPRQPSRFEVYPPARAGAQTLALVAIKPVPIDASGAGEITLHTEFCEALRHYLLYRAWCKDAEGAQNAALAAAHMAALADALGITPARPAATSDPTSV
jgi:hypothetical protein